MKNYKYKVGDKVLITDTDEIEGFYLNFKESDNFEVSRVYKTQTIDIVNQDGLVLYIAASEMQYVIPKEKIHIKNIVNTESSTEKLYKVGDMVYIEDIESLKGNGLQNFQAYCDYEVSGASEHGIHLINNEGDYLFVAKQELKYIRTSLSREEITDFFKDNFNLEGYLFSHLRDEFPLLEESDNVFDSKENNNKAKVLYKDDETNVSEEELNEIIKSLEKENARNEIDRLLESNNFEKIPQLLDLLQKK